MQVTGDTAYRGTCIFQSFEERVRKEFGTSQIVGFECPYASTHRGHGHSIEKGAEP